MTETKFVGERLGSLISRMRREGGDLLLQGRDLSLNCLQLYLDGTNYVQQTVRGRLNFSSCHNLNTVFRVHGRLTLIRDVFSRRTVRRYRQPQATVIEAKNPFVRHGQILQRPVRKRVSHA
jgi:hypothetical protein